MLESSRSPAAVQEVTAAFEQNVIAEVAAGDESHVEDALTAAHAAFRNKTEWLPLHERLAILGRIAEKMTSEAEDLAYTAALEGGKPLQDSKVEVTRAIHGIHLCIDAMRGDAGDVIPIATTPTTSGRLAFTQKEPIGVVAAVSAFNHPLNLIVHQVAPAIATGCPVIVKPADDTPLSCLNFVKIVRDAGLPSGWCQALIAKDIATAEKFVADPRVGFFSFIGSAKVGWMLRSKLAPGVRCALEHGGAAPVVLIGDYDQELALGSILKGGFYHAGQVCVSVQRVFAPRETSRTFATSLAERAGQLVVGDPTDPDTQVGPLIRPGEVKRVDEWVHDAVSAGAELLTGGMKISDQCYAPTVLLDPPTDARVSTAEIFGPVVCVYSYDDVDVAVAQANSLSSAFQAAVFTRDIDQAMSLYKKLDASAVMINDHTAFRDDVMPFAGLRESGLGVGGIPHTIEDMQINKMMVIRSQEL